MNGHTDLKRVIEVLENDSLLLEIFGDVVLYDPGSPDRPYSQPLFPKSLMIQRLTDYLSSNGWSEFPPPVVGDECVCSGE